MSTAARPRRAVRGSDESAPHRQGRAGDQVDLQRLERQRHPTHVRDRVDRTDLVELHLCGRHAVQVSPSQPAQVDLAALGQKLQSAGEVKGNDYLLRFRTGDYELTVFQDARSIIRGTDDIATARSLYAKYIGN